MRSIPNVRTARAATQGRNKIQEDRAMQRREHVARLRIEGYTYRQIAIELSHLNPPILNEETGKPYHYTQIKRDMDVIMAEWRENAQNNIGDHIARQLADIQEGKRQALRDGDLPSFARFIGLEMQLLGTDAPQKHEDWTGQDWREYASKHGYTEAEVIAEAERIISASARGEFVDSARNNRDTASGSITDPGTAKDAA